MLTTVSGTSFFRWVSDTTQASMSLFLKSASKATTARTLLFVFPKLQMLVNKKDGAASWLELAEVCLRETTCFGTLTRLQGFRRFSTRSQGITDPLSTLRPMTTEISWTALSSTCWTSFLDPARQPRNLSSRNFLNVSKTVLEGVPAFFLKPSG